MNLEVPDNVVFGFLGPNGAGKTTAVNSRLHTLKMLNKLGVTELAELSKLRAKNWDVNG